MSIPSWAVPGAKVVCIGDNGWHDALTGLDSTGPGFMEVVTISGIVPPGWWGYCGLLLEEYSDPEGFDIEDFRPLVDTTTDEEIEQRLFREKRLREPAHTVLTS